MAVKSISPVNPNMTIEQLKSVHELYSMFLEEWKLLYAAYEGTRELIRLGYLLKNERETPENYINRCQQAYGFNYTGSIVDLLNFHLCKKSVKRTLPKSIENDELFIMFQDDCNMEGDNIDDYLSDLSRLSSAIGFMGILVDKPEIELNDRQEQLDYGVYPYCSTFFPNSILDWNIERNEFGKPTLKMIKLRQYNNRILIWFEDHFEIWEIPTDKQGKELEATKKATLIKSLSHDLGEIPFIFLINKRWKKRPIGKSDVSDIARIDVSIIRNLSQGEEIIDYSAFPMMRKPWEESRPDGSTDKNDDVGPTAVLGFDPDNPDSKPDWLESQAEGALNAIKDWIINKVSEIYRSSNVGGMAAMEVSTVAKSGAALSSEFQMLNAALVRKAIILEKAEKMIYYFYYKWERPNDVKILDKETSVERDRSYDVENLAQDLENIITSKSIVMSKKFDGLMQKKAVRKMLPSYTDTQLQEIDDEIDSGIEAQDNFDKNNDYNPFEEMNLDQQNEEK